MPDDLRQSSIDPALQSRTLAAELAVLAEQLAAVMDRERTLLDQQGWHELTELGPEKSRLSMRYDALMATLITVPRIAIEADPACPRLRSAAERLNSAAQANALRLAIQIKATRRVADLIAAAARNAVSPRVTYGKTRAGFGARSGDTPPPVAVRGVY